MQFLLPGGGAVVNSAGILGHLNHITITCPACGMPIITRCGPETPHPDGTVEVDVSPAYLALSIHVRFGCTEP